MLWIIAAVVALVLGLQIVLQLTCVRIDRRKFAAPGIMVTIPGAEMHLCRGGSGTPPVILEAGIAASSINWRPLQAQLATLTTIYSYDRAGFGWSVARNRNCTLESITSDLHAMLDATHVPTPYVLVGHSFAAYIIRAYASRFPEEVGGVVLVDPLTPEEWISPDPSQRWSLRGGIWFSRAGGVLASLGVVRFCLWLLQRGKSGTPKTVLSAFGPTATETVGRILRELLKLPPDAVRVIRARWSTPKFFWTMADYIQSLPACAREIEGRPFPAQIPVTVISGAHQPQVRLDEHAALAAHSLHGRHVIAEKSRHWIHLDQPELVVEAVRDMVETVRSSSIVETRHS